MISRTHLVLAGLALAAAAPAVAGPDYSPSKKGQYPSTNFNAPDVDKLTIHGTGSTGEIPNMTVGGRPLLGLLSAVPQIENGQVKFFNGPVLGTIGPDGKFTLTPDAVTAPSFTLTGPGLSGPIDSGTVGGTAIPAILGSKAPLVSPNFSGTVMAPSFAGDGSAVTVGGATLPSVLSTKAPLANPIFSGTVTAPTLNVSGATSVGSLSTPGAVTAGSVTGDGAGITVGGTAIPVILGSKAPLASPTFSGTVTAPGISLNGSGLAGPIDSGTVGGTAVPTLLGAKAPLASPTFSGTVTAPALSVARAAGVGSLTAAGGISAGTLTGDGAGVTVGGATLPSVLNAKAPLASPSFSGKVNAPAFEGGAEALTVNGTALPSILGSKAALASPTFTGAVTAPSLSLTGSGIAGPIDSGTVGGTAIPTILGTKAPLASPEFSGTVKAPALSVSGATNVGSLSTSGAVTAGTLAGDGAGVTVSGTALPSALGAKAPLANPVFPGSVTAQSYSGLASGMKAGPLGSTLSLTLDTLFAQLPVSVASFGAVGDGSADDAPAINRAIQNRCAVGGGTVLLMRRHVIQSPIDNNCSRVLVRGAGYDTPHDNTPASGTIIVPTFAGTALRHRTRPASELGIPASSNTVTTGGGFVGMTVVGNCVATRLLQVTSTRGGAYDLTLLGAVGTEAALFDAIPDNRASVPQVGEASDTQRASPLRLNIRQDASTPGCATGNAHGLVFTSGTDGGPPSAGSGNPSYLVGVELTGRTYNGHGFLDISGDVISFKEFSMNTYGTGRPFYLQASTAGAVINNITFDFYGSNAVGYVEGKADRPGAIDPPLNTTIITLDASNGTPAPVAGAGASITILNGDQTWEGWTPTLTPGSGSYSKTAVPEARYYKRKANTVDFTMSVLVEHTGAGGVFNFTLPFPAARTAVFTAQQLNNNWSMTCRTTVGSVTAGCLRYDGGSILQGGNSFYAVSGSYETQ